MGGGHLQYKVEKKSPQKHTLSPKQTTQLVHNSYEQKKNRIPNHKPNPPKKAVKDPCNANFRKLEDKITELSLMSID